MARAIFIFHINKHSLQIQNVNISCVLISGGDVEEARAIGASNKHSHLGALETRCGDGHVAGSATPVLDRRKRPVGAPAFNPRAQPLQRRLREWLLF